MQLYNFLTRTTEAFAPIHANKVGMYVCGPTVYGPPHFGHARSAVVFDVLYRYLQYKGFSVRYVRNITDVGHMEDEVLEQGEDKMEHTARLLHMEPMELAHYYTLEYHRVLEKMAVLPPSIEPCASGHILEQQEFIAHLIDTQWAYEEQGNVYFDLQKFVAQHEVYGLLSGKRIEDALSGKRELQQQVYKRHPIDFALWKCTPDSHITYWSSPWGNRGVPGWHTECCVMSEKYLGIPFDIHGGGLDLQFPHHEAEIAQHFALHGTNPANFWLYNNMITIDNQKMSKSLGNFITMDMCFRGDHERLSTSYDPLFIRFFFLRAHYRSVIDVSDESLQAALQGYRKLKRATDKIISILTHNGISYCNYQNIGDIEHLLSKYENDIAHSQSARELKKSMELLMDKDMDTPQVIALLFKELPYIDSMATDTSHTEHIAYCIVYYIFYVMVLGLYNGNMQEGTKDIDVQSYNTIDSLVNTLISIRNIARSQKDYAQADSIRDALLSINIRITDDKEGHTYWEYIKE